MQSFIQVSGTITEYWLDWIAFYCIQCKESYILSRILVNMKGSVKIQERKFKEYIQNGTLQQWLSIDFS